MLPDAIDGSNTSRKRPRSASKNPDSTESSPKRATSEGPSLISESGKIPGHDEMETVSYGDVWANLSDGPVVSSKWKNSMSQGWRRQLGKEKLAIFTPHMQQSLKAGDSWYIVSLKWLNDWKMACGGEVNKEGIKDESSLGPVDNSMLLDEAGFLKAELEDETDFKLVPRSMWHLFIEWYGSPPHILERTVVAIGRSELIVDCFLPRLNVHRLRSDSGTNTTENTQPMKIETSLRSPAMNFFIKICRIFKSKPDDTRCYRVDGIDGPDNGPEYPLGLFQKSEHTLLEIYPHNSSISLSDLQVNPLDHIVVEIKGEVWPSDIRPSEASSIPTPAEPTKQEYTFKSGGFFGEVSNRLGITSATRSVNGQTEASTILKPALSLINKVKQASSSSRTPGLLGLGNLFCGETTKVDPSGNTCFMNSALQCLAHNEELTEYFMTDLYREELNRSNPLGMGGEIAESYGALLSRIWATSGGSSYSPREFKQQLQRFAPQFSGYQQHDSQEFLAFLLDGLHEDLNRVLQKPYVENPDWEGGGDKELVELARRSWEGYISRNDSAIVDLFQGQYKSTLVCPECHKVSITFDPFMYLTLPLPVKKKWYHEIYFVPWDLERPHLKIPVEIDNDLSFKELRRLIGRWMGVDAEHLVILEIFQHRFYKYLDDNTVVSDANPTDHVTCYELPCKLRVNERSFPSTSDNYLIVPVCMASAKPRSYSSQPDLIGHPFFLALTTEESRSLEAIYGALVKRVKRWTKNASTLYKYNGVNRPYDKEESLGDSELAASSSEIRGDGEFAIAKAGEEGVDISDIRTLEDADMVEVLSAPLGPQSELFDMDLYHLNSVRLSLEASYSMKKVPWGERQHDGQSLIIPGDIIYCKWEDTMESFFFKEFACWNPIDFQEFIHPEYEATRKANNKKQVDLSIEDCLDEFTKEEQLGEDDPWYCPRCKKHQQATKNLQIWKAPDVLVVHLKRFSNSRVLRDKIDAFIDFPVQGLDLEARVGERRSARTLAEQGYPLDTLGLDTNESLVYDLFGVDEHLGGLGGGHYRAYVKNHVDGEWYHFDDTHVTKCRASEAVNRNAYLLFYRRRATRPLGGKTHSKIQQLRQSNTDEEVLLPTPPDETVAFYVDDPSPNPEPWTPSLTLPLDSISSSSSPPALEDGDTPPGLDSTFTDALERSNLQFHMPNRLSVFQDRIGSPVSSSSNEAEDGGSDNDPSSPPFRKAILKPATFGPSNMDGFTMSPSWDDIAPEKSVDWEHRDLNRTRNLQGGLPSPESDDINDS
ncbi:hypothetical protein Clacol_005514 [Clathrus columnatus]|uniref:ubiquitinyl hydrolase 1 n=1 Tax=Clathrus columnatus TaxID=1419009 RepID=A0AAV5A9J3_9AGAM|nr:hypothetical protein Clacol_005514 [Clathrus columnatus]